MSMNKTVVAVAAMLMSAGVAAADDLNGDIPPQPSGVGNAIAETANAIKHATTDVANQELMDRTQVAKLYKAIDARIKEFEAQRKKVKALQSKELNAAVAAGKAKGDDKEQQAKDLKSVSDELKAADKELGEAITEATNMNKAILKVSTTQNPTDLNKSWTQLRKTLGNVNDRIKAKVESAATKTNHADEVIKKYAGTSTSSGSDATGAFKVTLKSWSCKKTEIYLGDAEYPNASKVNDSISASADGKFKMHVMLVGSRREQARKYEKLRNDGKADTSNIKVTAASNWVLNYEMLSGHKTTDWRVDKEEYEWKAPEGKSKVEGVPGPSGKNTKSKSDGIEISFPTAAATNSVHGWVRGEIAWKGAQDEQDSEDCQYEVTIAPNH